MKTKRQEKILEIIAAHAVTTQDELQSLLERAGYRATQATISRDIKELRLVKTLSAAGHYYYARVPVQNREELSINLTSIFFESVERIDYSGNIVVVKCKTGMANAVCATIDTGTWEGLVGTIAGDDTIFLLMRSELSAEDFVGYLQEIVERSKASRN